MRYALPALLLLVTGCVMAPIDRTALRQRTERNCRVKAAVSPAYAVDSTGAGLRNVAFDRCMRSAGFTTAEG